MAIDYFFYNQRPSGKKKPPKKYRQNILKFLPRFILIFFIALAGLFLFSLKDLPNPEKINQRRLAESTKIYDRTGQVLLYDVHGEEKRTAISFSEIPLSLKQATLAAEDANFYKHFGVDFKAILRAGWTNLKGQKISQGGSTITQQFIKNSFLSPERTFDRKIKEIILALELEIRYSKDEILGFYLNQVPYGSNAYGVEAASQTFFNKSTKDLTLAESALLASLPKAPTYYSPFGSHPEELKKRQEYILDRLASLNYISHEEASQAKAEPLNFSKSAAAIKAPHFIMYVKEYLENQYGRDFIEQAGLKITTTLDADLQQAAEQIVSEGAEKNQKNFQVFNAALTAIDPKNGQILAMVGSRDYFGESLPKKCDPGKTCKFDPNVNVVIRERQPGSAFKPFAYTKAFQKGYTPQTMLFDLETEFAAEGVESYKPQNYDGKFRGPVSMREALAQSLNIPSVKTLYLAGVNDTINLSQDMGITTLKDRQRYGLSLVLGGGEVKLLDMAIAYGTLSNEGTHHAASAILKIEDKGGKILEEFKDDARQVIDPQITRTVTSILSDNQARAPIFGDNSPLYFPERPTAAKTGTTQEYRDAWTLGYTPSLVIGVWAGNNDNSPMAKAGAGLYAAAPLWHQFLNKAYQLKTKNDLKDLKPNEFYLPAQVENFNQPEISITGKAVLDGQIENERKIKIDKISGQLATDLTPPELIEEKTYKEIHSILYYVDKNSPRSETPVRPENDPQFWNWERPILEWAKKFLNVNQLPPVDFDTIHQPENQPQIIFISPNANENIEKIINIKTEVLAPLGVKQVDFFFDDDLIGSTAKPPFIFTWTIPAEIKKGQHLLKAAIFDRALNRREAQIFVFTP